jgi:hypothetical protein
MKIEETSLTRQFLTKVVECISLPGKPRDPKLYQSVGRIPFNDDSCISKYVVKASMKVKLEIFSRLFRDTVAINNA